MELTIKILSIALVTYYITSAYIFKSLREFMSNAGTLPGKLFSCQECAGVWIGIAFLFYPHWFCEGVVIVLGGGILAEVLFNVIRKIKT